MGMGFPRGMGIPWGNPMVMGIDVKIGNGNGKEWETIHVGMGNGNGFYSYGNKFPFATVFDDNPVLHRKQRLVKADYNWAYFLSINQSIKK